jgi:hypothetical protein
MSSKTINRSGDWYVILFTLIPNWSERVHIRSRNVTERWTAEQILKVKGKYFPDV